MYIGYLHDRKKLGFSCIEDVRAAKQISDFKNFIKRTRGVSVAYIVKNYGDSIHILKLKYNVSKLYKRQKSFRVWSSV